MQCVKHLRNLGGEQYGNLDYFPILISLGIGLYSFILSFNTVQFGKPFKIDVTVGRFDLLFNFLISGKYILFLLLKLFPVHYL